MNQKLPSKLINDLMKRSQVRLMTDPNDGMDHHKALVGELKDATDRTIAIVWGTCVEEALRYAISTRMGHLTDADVNRLFQPDGVISSFTDKIQIGRLLKLYGPAYQQELNYIRTIRNSFAHSDPGLKFESPEVEAICRVFQANRYTWGWDPETVAPKEKFETACDFYWCYFRNQRIEVQGGPIDPRWPPFPPNS